jgi:hypothetical protein
MLLLLMSGSCREALLDALELARQVAPTGSPPPQQQQQRQRDAQQAAQPKRLFGVSTPEFGALLDLPDAWWAAFPQKRQRRRQQQQQQHREQYNQQQL